ncbi:16S rRNA (guanine(966)-N(2))-methyltransferase RsmD [Sulfuriflexus mobilis]|uniref:16S rRNA (guanine(966)-N(2))-methyltransferase RsmD n=1 Tax=Sulfuriflexus mobilis TaxID=1811807 RepID=UPI000F840592|nr:16S rRNA (guanine(966)-N(2))-methyltransferase RsmD [Sulfuriflexus mobilis]
MARPSNTLRIIGGELRGRKLSFPDAKGLRPTPDRVRETLFNWLQAQVYGARCLDLFAGSGALGLEALSRGAAEVVFVERDGRVLQKLRENLLLLGQENGRCIQASAEQFLRGAAEPFDIVFLDPPFQTDELAGLCASLEAGGWLREGFRLYMERPQRLAMPPLPAGWQVLRETRAGESRACLIGRG